LPKRIGLNHPEAIAKAVNAHEGCSHHYATVHLVTDTFHRVLLSVLQIRPSADGKITEEEIKGL
jgi:putative hemolysin